MRVRGRNAFSALVDKAAPAARVSVVGPPLVRCDARSAEVTFMWSAADAGSGPRHGSITCAYTSGIGLADRGTAQRRDRRHRGVTRQVRAHGSPHEQHRTGRSLQPRRRGPHSNRLQWHRRRPQRDSLRGHAWHEGRYGNPVALRVQCGRGIGALLPRWSPACCCGPGHRPHVSVLDIEDLIQQTGPDLPG
jgi:hypothetical protein